MLFWDEIMQVSQKMGDLDLQKYNSVLLKPFVQCDSSIRIAVDSIPVMVCSLDTRNSGVEIRFSRSFSNEFFEFRKFFYRGHFE